MDVTTSIDRCYLESECQKQCGSAFDCGRVISQHQITSPSFLSELSKNALKSPFTQNENMINLAGARIKKKRQ